MSLERNKLDFVNETMKKLQKPKGKLLTDGADLIRHLRWSQDLNHNQEENE